MVLAVAFLEFQSRKVNSVSEVDEGLGIRVVGELPNVSGRVWRRMKGGKGPSVLKALMAERIDGTRTALIHTTSADPPLASSGTAHSVFRARTSRRAGESPPRTGTFSARLPGCSATSTVT